MAEASINSAQAMALPLAGFPSPLNINVFAGIVQKRPTLLVNARELHFSLEVELEFTPWIAGRMAVYGYVGGQDYVPVLRGGIPAAEHQRAFSYFLSLDMAKELAIIEPGDRSKAVKHYLQRFDQRHQAAETLATMLSPGTSWNAHSGGKVSMVWDSERGGFLEFRGEKPVVKAPPLANAAEPVVSRDQVVAAAPAAEVPPIFRFETGEIQIRTRTDDKGNPWFCAADICAVLGYANPWQAVQKNCRDGGVTKREVRCDLSNREVTSKVRETQEMTFINEGNLYRLIIKSRKPEAEKFEKWVMDELLPTIRKTGRYEIPQQTAKPTPVPASAPLLPGLNIGEEDTLLKHLVENLLRDKMPFWDTANGVMRLKEILESEQGGQTLGIRSFEAALRERGLVVSKTDIARYLFATKKLSAFAEGLPYLTPRFVSEVQPLFNRYAKFSLGYAEMAEDALYLSILNPAMSEHGQRFSMEPKPTKFDFEEFMGLCDTAMSTYFDVSIGWFQTVIDGIRNNPDAGYKSSQSYTVH